MNTGYDWKEPTEEEIDTVNNLINKILPIQEERDYYLSLLSTCLDGKVLDKFIIANGSGGNGKSFLHTFLVKSLGNYAMIGSNSILCENKKTGSNPELANLHMKRMVVFREPPEKNKFQNSIIKELTGDSVLSCRGLYESNTKKTLCLTMIVECNKKPILAEKPTDADIRRIVDVLFPSKFTEMEDKIDNIKVFPINEEIKKTYWQNKHRYAILNILMNYYSKKIEIPSGILERTNQYIEDCCDITKWFNENYEKTEDKNDIIKVKDIHLDFLYSEVYTNMSKHERKDYNKNYFTKFFSSHKIYNKFYINRTAINRNSLHSYRRFSSDDI